MTLSEVASEAPGRLLSNETLNIQGLSISKSWQTWWFLHPEHMWSGWGMWSMLTV